MTIANRLSVVALLFALSFPSHSWAKQIELTGRYFDADNFACRITCPSLVSTGLIDETCPPVGVLATFNQIKGKKQILIMPKSNHHGDGNAQAAFFGSSERWLKDLVQGKSPPFEKASGDQSITP